MSLTVGTDAAGVRAAAAVVRAGGVLIYPTETVYGIGGDAGVAGVAERVRVLKGHDADKPLLAIVDAWQRVRNWTEAPDAATLRVMAHEPPLPVTLLLRAGTGAPAGLVGPEGFVGVRRTSDDFCRALIAAADAPLVSTSANVAGAPAPAEFAEIGAAIRNEVDLVVDAGRRLAGVPSTVARIEAGRVEVARAGAVDSATLEGVAAGRG